MCFRPTAVAMTKKCSQCSHECELNMDVCPECGTKLPSTPSMPEMPSAPGKPSAPGAPSAPGMPGVPGTPSTPGRP